MTNQQFNEITSLKKGLEAVEQLLTDNPLLNQILIVNPNFYNSGLYVGELQGFIDSKLVTANTELMNAIASKREDWQQQFENINVTNG